jgi:hypothetical protein
MDVVTIGETMTVYAPNEEGPLPHIPLMPAGRVNLDYTASFF